MRRFFVFAVAALLSLAWQAGCGQKPESMTQTEVSETVSVEMSETVSEEMSAEASSTSAEPTTTTTASRPTTKPTTTATTACCPRTNKPAATTPSTTATVTKPTATAAKRTTTTTTACCPTEKPTAPRPTTTTTACCPTATSRKTSVFRFGIGADSRPTTTTTTTAPATPAAPAETVSGEIGEVFRLVNAARAQNGLPELTYRADVQAAADTRAAEIVAAFAHTRPDGRSCFTALSDTGVSYRAAGENIAAGYRDAAAVMDGWMNSSGHRANILSDRFTGMAVGLYETAGRRYWVQTFVG